MDKIICNSGVLNMADANTVCKKLKGAMKPVASVDAYAMILCLTGGEEFQLRLTCLFTPPSEEITAEGLAALTNEATQTWYKDGQCISHLTVGDFNPNCCQGGSDALIHE